MTSNATTATRSMGQRLRSALPGSRDTNQSGRPSADTTIPEVQIVAYGEDHITSGRISLSGERVSDVLNDHSGYSLSDVLMEDLGSGRTIAVHGLLLLRDDVIVVDASGPRGNVARRRHTCQHPIVAEAGRYQVRGNVHALPGCDPIASLRGRKPLVAITDAVITYATGSDAHRREIGLLLLNRDRIDWIAKEVIESGASITMPTEATGPLFKDYTGLLYA